jgi:hypothetical protein
MRVAVRGEAVAVAAGLTGGEFDRQTLTVLEAVAVNTHGKLLAALLIRGAGVAPRQ